MALQTLHRDVGHVCAVSGAKCNVCFVCSMLKQHLNVQLGVGTLQGFIALGTVLSDPCKAAEVRSIAVHSVK